jgi:adenylosuccinate synthase
MPVTVVIGGQYGSEGKGKVAQFLAERDQAAAVVRVGGTNSGHTGMGSRGSKHVLRQLPTAAWLPHTTCVLGPGSYIDLEILRREIELTALSANRLRIDARAMLITPGDVEAEAEAGLRTRIGSTGSGTGAAVCRRIERRADAPLAQTVAQLRPYVCDTTELLREYLGRGERVIVEGTQGFGLSVLHSPDYPYATSRDTSAAGALSEAGLSPLDVDAIVMVIRTFPIRVGGNSGPLPEETTWADVARDAGSEHLEEFTSVTRVLRRVGEIDVSALRSAIAANQPTSIVLNHLDYVDASCSGSPMLPIKAQHFVTQLASEIGRRIDFVGVSPDEIVPFKPAYALASA